jgi:hypothetical protein
MNDPGGAELEPDPPFIPDAAPLRVEAPPAPGVARVWTVGSLTYTRAGLVVLFSLLLWGDFAWSMKERSAAPILQNLVLAFGASHLEMQMFMVIIPNAISAVLTPIVSYRSDRHRGRWGRRIPFLLVSTPFAVLAMMGLGFSPAMGAAFHALLGRYAPDPNTCTRMFFGMFWVIFEVATVVANSVFGGLINDVVPRKFLGRFYGLFRAFSLIAGMICFFKLYGIAKDHYRAIFLSIGVLYGLGFTFMCLTVEEGKYPEPKERVQVPNHNALHAIKIYCKECFGNSYYIWITLAIMLGTLTFMPVNNFSQPFSHTLKIQDDDYGKYIAATYFVSLILSFFLGELADWLHPLRIGIVAMAMYACITFWGQFHAAQTAVLFSVHYGFAGASHSVPVQFFAIALIGHGVISGIYFTCTASLAQRLLPRGHFAQFASAAQVLTAVCSIAFALGTGWFFDRYGPVYHYTYTMGFALAVAGVFAMLMVHRGFMRYGGMNGYVAP